MPSYFNMYPNCVTTKGTINSLIVDYKNELYFRIPTFLIDALKELSENNFEHLLLKYQSDPDLLKKVNDLKDWLVRNNIGMMASIPKFFAPIKNNFEFSTLSNVVIEISDPIDYYSAKMEKILVQLIQLKCQAIQLIFIKKMNLDAVKLYMKIFETYIFNSLEVVLTFELEPSLDELKEFLYQNLMIKKIYAFGCKVQNIIPLHKLNAVIVFSTQRDYSPSKCGFICKEYFSLSLMTYFEGQKHNTCLNQKLAIDAEGNIKNCLAFKEAFGNISKNSIQNTIHDANFQKYWNISKNLIHTCKDCEFRSICTDCRAYVEDPGDIYSKPLKCGYDPDTGNWESWSLNPLKQNIIDYYKL